MNLKYRELLVLANEDRPFPCAFYVDPPSDVATQATPPGYEEKSKKLRSLRAVLSRLFRLEPEANGELSRSDYSTACGLKMSIIQMRRDFVKLSLRPEEKMAAEDLYVARFVVGAVKHYLDPFIEGGSQRLPSVCMAQTDCSVFGEELAKEVGFVPDDLPHDVHVTAEYVRKDVQYVNKKEGLGRTRRHHRVGALTP